MNICQTINVFSFDDHFVFNQNINSIATIKRNLFIYERENFFSFNKQSGLCSFISKTSFVYIFE